jgi:hypothetical protein
MSEPLSLRRGAQSLVLLAALLGSAAWAQVPVSALSMSFTAPSGLIGPTDSVDVVVRLSNNDATGAFVVDPGQPNIGLDASFLPTTGYYTDPDTNASVASTFVTWDSGFLGLAFGCSGSFTSSCTDGPPYNFNFSSYSFELPFSLAAGASLEFTLGTFVPSAGPVAAGTYQFFRAPLALWIFGTDADGHNLSTITFPVSTCDFDNATDCAGKLFERTVVGEVPEPAGWGLMALGLPLVGWRLRQHARQRTAPR